MSHRLITTMTVVLITLLAGCANPQLKLYDEAQSPASQAARLTVPEAIEIARINGVVAGGGNDWNLAGLENALANLAAVREGKAVAL